MHHWGPTSSRVDQNTSPPARSTPVTAEEPSTVEAGWLGGMNGVKLEALT